MEGGRWSCEIEMLSEKGVTTWEVGVPYLGKTEIEREYAE